MHNLLLVSVLFCASLAAQEVPKATELSGSPFFIKNTWFIGGAGSWDYLTMDATAQRLFIAHGSAVQVLDAKTGTVAGEIDGLREAHTIALDDTGEFGYISDGRANEVKVFDRTSLQIVAAIPTVPNLRALAFEPRTKLLFAVCSIPVTAAATAQMNCATTQPTPPRTSPNRTNVVSSIAVIDTVTRTAVGQILLPGKLGFAIADGIGAVYINITDRNQVLRIDAEAIAALLQKQQSANASAPPIHPPTSLSAFLPADQSANPSASDASLTPPATIDWSRTRPPEEDAHTFSLPGGCQQPVGLAIDGVHFRLFAACDNWKLAVLNTSSGQVVTTLTTGPGTDAIAYDAERGLIFSANGGGYGSLTVVRQDVTTDTYAVIQVLPTRERARTLAVDTSTGEVYLVTDFHGVDLARPGTIGSMKAAPINGSFQVLDIGH